MDRTINTYINDHINFNNKFSLLVLIIYVFICFNCKNKIRVINYKNQKAFKKFEPSSCPSDTHDRRS